jgi:uncharacterized protein
VALASILLVLAAIGGPDAAVSSVERPAAVAAAPSRLTGYVVDQAGVLSSPQRQQLTQQLSRFQRETAHQMVVVTVNSLNGEDVARFTDRLGNRWGIGRRGINDGIVVLVSPHDRRARISVGSGLARQLPDALCQRVMDQIMIPAFKAGQIGLGIERGVAALLRRLSFPGTDIR